MHHVIELVSSHLAREREGWKGVKQNHNCGKNVSMVQMHASTKGFSEVPVKWPHESASCGYADESELNSSETKASINTPELVYDQLVTGA